MRLRVGGRERDGPVEALERLGKAILILAQESEVEYRGQEIRCDRDPPLEEPLGLIGASGAGRNGREQAHGIDVSWILAQDPLVQLLGLFKATFLLVLGRLRHQPAFG